MSRPILLAALTLLLTLVNLPQTQSYPAIFHPQVSAANLLRHSRNPSSFSHVFRRQQLADTCNQIFAAGSTNPLPTDQALVAVGDSWLQAFGNPVDGFLCSFSVGIAPTVVPVVATLTLYTEDVSQQSILQGLAVPFASADARSNGDRLIFTFCGEFQAPLTEGAATTFVVTLGTSVAPLNLLFDQGEGTGIFFGPSIPDGQSGSISQSLTFNITTSDTNPECPIPGDVETTTTATTTVTTESATSSASETLTSTSTVATTTTTTEEESDVETSTTATSTNEAETTATTTTSTATASPTPTDCTVSNYRNGFDNCTIAAGYIANCINSPTLKLCYEIACIYNANNKPRFIAKALYQCSQLDYYARLTSANPGQLPKNW
ncbi:hypothetical protein HK097_000951 [Rhizophlyctis rosea]|uniref:Uncharacterized protein n=1 Tax=Rhizophlyctis rosea TaxID=64517 RepID=A0AAD5S748_9FUNG|nr:hypothetical protein HK097_000951 [Rhizophlyctis rosea]